MDTKQRNQIELAIQNARKLISHLESLLETGPIHVSPDVAEMVATRIANHICLGCLKPIVAGQKVKRGNHVACYQTQRSRMLKGETTEIELVQDGKWTAESNKPGRKAAIDQAAEIIAKEIADKIAPPKVAEPKDKYKKQKGD